MDLDMYYAKTDTPALVRTMTLNEELGQISHIFSDKTGTLTCNIMDFRKFSVGGISYGEGITEIGKVAWKLQGRHVPEEVLRAEEIAKERSIPHVSFYCPKYEIDVKSKGDLKNKIKFFFKVLATCHDVIAEHTESGVVPSASNPDDEAIVAAADFFGYEFLDREEKIIVLKNTETGQLEKLELIESIEFSSKRKRMSVIVRDLMTNKLMLMTKGADTVMIERLNKSSSVSDEMFPNQSEILKKTIDHMNQYSVEGLRCLLIAFKYIDEPQLNSWLDKYRKASTDISQIDLKKRGEKNQIEDLHNELERDLVLVGCTAIEDRLQDGVPECIAMLAKAGINIWMLTGDKEETAINIAIACNLLQPKEYMRHVIVNNSTCPNDSSTLQLLKNEINVLNYIAYI
jgi:magnesium-transporting ATPase (P-type)